MERRIARRSRALPRTAGAVQNGFKDLYRVNAVKVYYQQFATAAVDPHAIDDADGDFAEQLN